MEPLQCAEEVPKLEEEEEDEFFIQEFATREEMPAIIHMPESEYGSSSPSPPSSPEMDTISLTTRSRGPSPFKNMVIAALESLGCGTFSQIEAYIRAHFPSEAGALGRIPQRIAGTLSKGREFSKIDADADPAVWVYSRDEIVGIPQSSSATNVWKSHATPKRESIRQGMDLYIAYSSLPDI